MYSTVQQKYQFGKWDVTVIDLHLAIGRTEHWKKSRGLFLGNWNEKRFDGFVLISATLSFGPCSGNDAKILRSNISVAPLSL